MQIEIPYKWTPRHYQLPAFKYLQGGGKRALLFWHRRSGKDEMALHWSATSIMQKAATYWHMLPEAAQARKAIWEAVNPHTGKRRIDEAFPHEIRATTREQEMMIKFINGSTWQVVGSDNYNSLIGSPPYGVVYSEWAVNDPASWAYLRPILAENGGWALFITTPRGENHAKIMYDGARNDPLWYTEVLTAEDTGVYTPAQLLQEKEELCREYGKTLGEAYFNQEYYCSFSAARMGAFFGDEMGQVDKEGRITKVPHDSTLLVYTGWDIGKNMNMAIWCLQPVGLEHRALKYITGLRDIPSAVRALQETGYLFGGHYLPHDAEPEQLTTGDSIKTQVEKLGLKNVEIVPQVKAVSERISAIRALLPFAVFDREGCEYGINALKHYGVEWDDKLKKLRDTPKHDWSSHPCDAFGTYAQGYNPSELNNSFDYRDFYG